MPDGTHSHRDVVRPSDTARLRANVLCRESAAINHAMVVLARWIGEADAAQPSTGLGKVRRVAA